MLQHLSIRDFTIIDLLEVDFSNGLCVITGETGAGKSILVKALSLLLGAKGHVDLIRSGKERASICGVFFLSLSHRAVSQLESLGIPFEEDEGGKARLVLRRDILAKGKQGAWINDVPMTLGSLKIVGEQLIDILSQFEHHRIFERSYHLELIDETIQQKKILSRFQTAYDEAFLQWKNIEKELEALSFLEKEADYIGFRLEILNEFQPSEEDYLETKEKVEVSRKFGKTRQILEKATTLLEESVGADGAAVVLPVREAARLLSHFDDWQSVREDLEQAAHLIEGAAQAVWKARQREDDPATEQVWQERLDGYYDLMRRFAAPKLEDLCAVQKELQDKMLRLTCASEKLSSMAETFSLAVSELESCAATLNRERKKVAEKLCLSVNKELQDLGMEHAQLKVQWEALARKDFWKETYSSVLDPSLKQRLRDLAKEKLPHASGLEGCFFLIRTNKGEAFMPLEKGVSGGEASRIMLALKSSFLSGGDTCILVFDEIDTGISGRIATKVGRKLHQLAKNFQVISVSHLAQVACFADAHYRVEKRSENHAKRTGSFLTLLDDKSSLEELARLLSGDSVTSSSLANARTLKEAARPL